MNNSMIDDVLAILENNKDADLSIKEFRESLALQICAVVQGKNPKKKLGVTVMTKEASMAKTGESKPGAKNPRPESF